MFQLRLMSVTVCLLLPLINKRTLDGRRLRHVKKEQQLISWKQQKLEEMKTVVDKKPEEKPVDNISESVSKWLEQV